MALARHDGIPQITFLVSSCDRFSDCWPGFAYGIDKYWPDCPFPITLITNHKDIDHPRITCLKVGDDHGWSYNLLAALEHIDSPFILYAQEDYWIKRQVDTKIVLDYIELLESNRADYIRLIPCPPPDGPVTSDERLSIISQRANYRTSLQMALWRKDILKQLIEPGETPWHFELEGSARSRIYAERFLSAREMSSLDCKSYYLGIEYVCTAVVKGKWSREALEFAYQEGLTLDFSKRPVESWWDIYSRDDPIGQNLAKLIFIARHPDRLIKKVASLNRP